MTENEIFLRIKEIIVDHTQYEESDKITMDSRLTEDVNIDSLDKFEIIYDIENEFKIKITDEDAQKFVTIADIVNYVETKKN